MLKNFFNSKGFSLMEAVVSIGVIAIVGIILADILTRTFSSNNKTQLISRVKQNGQVALNVIDREIRNTEAIVCPTPPDGVSSISLNTIVVIKNGVYTRFKLHPETGTTNGFIGQDNSVVTSVSTACTESQDSYISLTNQTDNGVSVKDLSFTRNRISGSPDTITISFSLAQPVGASTGFQTELGQDALFQTTVQLR